MTWTPLLLEPHTEEWVVEHVSRRDMAILRRVLKARVPSLAIYAIEMVHNTSKLTSEQWLHNLQFVPLRAPKSFVEGMVCMRVCDCEFKNCDKCAVWGDLVARGNSRGRRDVKDSEITWRREGVDTSHDDDPLFGPTVLGQLGPGEEVRLRVVVRKGFHRIHARHDVLRDVTFHQAHTLNIDTEGWDDHVLSKWEAVWGNVWSSALGWRSQRVEWVWASRVAEWARKKGYDCPDPIPVHNTWHLVLNGTGRRTVDECLSFALDWLSNPESPVEDASSAEAGSSATALGACTPPAAT
jgi:hypothetical protein